MNVLKIVSFKKCTLIYITENYWIITDLSPSLRYVFRVRSINKYGWSNFSVVSKPFDFTEAAMLAKQQELGIVLTISIPIAVVAICVIGMFIMIYGKYQSSWVLSHLTNTFHFTKFIYFKFFNSPSEYNIHL
jgi:hypothetical protein